MDALQNIVRMWGSTKYAHYMWEPCLAEQFWTLL